MNELMKVMIRESKDKKGDLTMVIKIFSTMYNQSQN